MSTNTSASVSPSKSTMVYFERQNLKHAGPVAVLDKFGLTKPMPKNKGTLIEFKRPNVFSPADMPLVEGVTPAARSFSYSVVNATLKQYGDLAELTDVVADTHEDPVLNDLSVQMGENIGRTVESLIYGVVKAGTSVIYANGSARTDVNTVITVAKIRAATRALDAQKAMPVTRMLDGSPNYQTKPIEGGYIAIGHTDLKNDIRNLAGFTPVAEYGQRKPIHDREVGSVEEVRIILSPDLDPWADAGGAKGSMVSTSGTSADVYPLLIFGKEAYGTVALRGMGAVEPTIIPVDQKTKDDPLGQRGYCGWKTWHTSKILNEAWIQRVECAVTAL